MTLQKLVPEKGLEDVKRAPTAADIAGLGERLLPQPPGRSARRHLRVRQGLRAAGPRRQGAGRHLRPHRPRARPPRPRPAVLVLLVLQPVQRPPRGRLGGDAGRLRLLQRRAARWRRTERDRSSSSTPAASAPTGATARSRRKGRTRSSTRRRAPTRPSTTPPSTSRTARKAPASAATTPPRRCAGSTCARSSSPPPPPTTGAFEWLTYTGHWGQKEKGFNNGPTGPTTKTQWLEPFTWMEEQRSTSPRLPGGSVVGPNVSRAFCGAVATASDLINLEAKSRPAAIATIAVARPPDRPLRRGHHAGGRSTSSGCARGAPSASSSAPPASSTAATG